MKCNWCNQEITNSPYVVKKWQGLDEDEKYHSHCFVVAHQGLLDNAPKRAIDKYNSWKSLVNAERID